MPRVDRAERKTHFPKVESFKEELRSHTAIESVGGTSNMPGGGTSDINSTTTKIGIVGKTDGIEGTTYIQFNDDHFLETMNMKVLAGRNFDRKFKTDTAAVMVNEAFSEKI